VRDGAIAAVEARAGRVGVDLDGDLLIPGLVELHTDNLEKHYSPRIGVVWDAVSAAIAHDVQCAGSGITTVFDSLVLGAAPGWEVRDDWLRPMLAGCTCAARSPIPAWCRSSSASWTSRRWASCR
jgi:alpha-D-ribose 1-methylphosphonate 5-triphosphate diphosphatase